MNTKTKCGFNWLFESRLFVSVLKTIFLKGKQNTLWWLYRVFIYIYPQSSR
jgi:hypothetical protein